MYKKNIVAASALIVFTTLAPIKVTADTTVRILGYVPTRCDISQQNIEKNNTKTVVSSVVSCNTKHQTILQNVNSIANIKATINGAPQNYTYTGNQLSIPKTKKDFVTYTLVIEYTTDADDTSVPNILITPLS